MPALGQEELFEACRVIYKMAGDSFMLPPLIRDAKSLEAKSSHTYYSLTETDCIRLVVDFDKDYVDQNKFPLTKLPLRFRCELCDLDFKNVPIELGELEGKALIRAFFLGAKAPIIVEKNALAPSYKLRIQLSSTFFVECGELIDEGGDLTFEAICRRVGSCLYDMSMDFFECPQDGLTVWSTRAAQELFGAPKPAPDAFWPLASREAETMACRRARTPAVETAPVLADSRVSESRVPAVVPDLAAAPVFTSPSRLSVFPVHSAGAVMEAARPFFPSAIAACMMFGVTSLTASYVFRSEFSASPRTAASRALTVSAAVLPERAAYTEASAGYVLSLDTAPQISPVQFAGARETAAKLSGATPAHEWAPQVVAGATPAPLLDSAVARTSPPAPKSAATANPGDGGEKLQKKGAAATKAGSPRAGHGKQPAHRAGHRQASPLAVVRRAVNTLAAVVAKNLRRIPYRFSSLISGR